MWFVNILRDVISNSLENLTVQTRGRFKFYTLFYLVTAFISFVIVISIVYLVLYIQIGNNTQVVESLLMNAYEDWFYITFPVNILMVLFLIKHFHEGGVLDNHTYSLSQLIRSIKTPTVVYFLGSSVIVALIIAFYNFNDLSIYQSSNNFELMLETLDGDGNPWVSRLIDGLLSLLIEVFPLLALGLYALRLRKKKKINYEIALWKLIIGFVFIGIVVVVVFDEVEYIIDSTVMNFIRIPFQSGEIPMIFSMLISIFLNALFFMVFSTMAHYSFENTKNESRKRVTRNDSPDILDQI